MAVEGEKITTVRFVKERSSNEADQGSRFFKDPKAVGGEITNK